jgi:hypothetical protein
LQVNANDIATTNAITLILVTLLLLKGNREIWSSKSPPVFRACAEIPVSVIGAYRITTGQDRPSCPGR